MRLRRREPEPVVAECVAVSAAAGGAVRLYGYGPGRQPIEMVVAAEDARRLRAALSPPIVVDDEPTPVERVLAERTQTRIVADETGPAPDAEQIERLRAIMAQRPGRSVRAEPFTDEEFRGEARPFSGPPPWSRG